MTVATHVGAEVQVSLSNVVSDAQLVNGDNKFTGQVTGYLVQVETQLSEGYSLGVAYNNGRGDLDTAANKYTFSEGFVFGMYQKAHDRLSSKNWILQSEIGFGFFDKASSFKNINYRQSQFPILLGLNATSRSGISIGFSGYGQLDNLNNNRVGSLFLNYPLSGALNLLGRYTSHKSKVRSFQHCGSDYSIGLSFAF
ncbi:hypothetical protein OAO92_08865 [Paracoccaceae bacterium]|nr:hypothetical protein [Paracoccaceae bacterium]MDC0583566.1 hypothetical protein [Paracoccaceae bacterium]